MNVDSIIPGDDEHEDFDYELSRVEFEDVCKHIFEKLIPPVIDALDDAQMTKEDIDDVVLVGGSTRIPAA